MTWKEKVKSWKTTWKEKIKSWEKYFSGLSTAVKIVMALAVLVLAVLIGIVIGVFIGIDQNFGDYVEMGLAIIIAGATITYVVLTYRMLEEMRLQRELENEPNVIAWIGWKEEEFSSPALEESTDENLIYNLFHYFKNIGGGPAIGVKIDSPFAKSPVTVPNINPECEERIIHQKLTLKEMISNIVPTLIEISYQNEKGKVFKKLYPVIGYGPIIKE